MSERIPTNGSTRVETEWNTDVARGQEMVNGAKTKAKEFLGAVLKKGAEAAFVGIARGYDKAVQGKEALSQTGQSIKATASELFGSGKEAMKTAMANARDRKAKRAERRADARTKRALAREQVTAFRDNRINELLSEAKGIQDSLKDGGEMSSEGEGEDTSNSAESYQLDSAESNAFQRRVNLSRANRALEEINNKLADAERAEGIAKAKLEEKKKVHGEAVDALNNDPDNLDLRAKEKRASADVDDAQGEYNKASKATDSLVDKSNENNSRREEILKTIKDSADQARHRKELRGRLNEINKELSPLLDERSAEELTKRVVDFAKKIIAKIGNRLKSTTVEKALADGGHNSDKSEDPAHKAGSAEGAPAATPSQTEMAMAT